MDEFTNCVKTKVSSMADQKLIDECVPQTLIKAQEISLNDHVSYVSIDLSEEKLLTITKLNKLKIIDQFKQEAFIDLPFNNHEKVLSHCYLTLDEFTRLLAQTTLRNMLGTHNLHEILSDREKLATSMQDVRLPVQLQRAMAAEAEAAREARAKVIAAEGEQKASRALKEAAEVLSLINKLDEIFCIKITKNDFVYLMYNTYRTS
ncbi:hypothetical protein RND71_043390 [Anisodus tanguticus]|uniref:Band 7 domain-containing protein n=1 Tax=Anisodus tanguticus TaxID=243964 RepID=A0AAE1UNA2_9SOLA|nr:hypothetical protein RND71_043390 [Anisodus tanguticus]